MIPFKLVEVSICSCGLPSYLMSYKASPLRITMILASVEVNASFMNSVSSLRNETLFKPTSPKKLLISVYICFLYCNCDVCGL